MFVVVSFCLYCRLRVFISFPVCRLPADFELAQLQEKLRETELVMENIVSNAHHSPERWVCVFAEESFHQSASSLSFPERKGWFD